MGEGKTFSSYKQMHEILINNNSAIKKWTKRDPERGKIAFQELLIENDGMEEWSPPEMAEFSVELLGVALNVGMFVSEEMQNKLDNARNSAN